MSISTFTLPSFKFLTGDVLDVNLVYKSINPSGTKKALITNCFTGKLDTTVSYTEPSQALADYHVVVAMQMGMGESTSPSNTPKYPETVGYHDQVHAQYQLVKQVFNFDHLDVVLGFSMGGQATYHWAAMYPDFVKNGVVICSAGRTNEQTYAIVNGLRGALTLSKDWDAYVATGEKPVQGCRAMQRSYTPWLFSPAWWRQEQFKKMGMESFKQFLQFLDDGFLPHDQHDLVAQCKQWQHGDVGEVGGGLQQTLQSIKARMLLLPSKTDYQFPPEDSEIEAGYLKHAELTVIPTIWGHTAGFGYNPDDIAWIDARLKTFLSA